MTPAVETNTAATSPSNQAPHLVQAQVSLDGMSMSAHAAGRPVLRQLAARALVAGIALALSTPLRALAGAFLGGVLGRGGLSCPVNPSVGGGIIALGGKMVHTNAKTCSMFHS
jgi:hypothetical protein